MAKEYMGDSVYAEITEDGTLIVTTENGCGPSNTIMFEPEVFAAMTRYVTRYIDSLKEERKA